MKSASTRAVPPEQSLSAPPFAVSAFHPRPATKTAGRRVGKMNRTMGARHNREIVLHMICALGAVSQSQIARATQLRRSTVFYVLRDLRRRGLVCDGDVVASTRVGPKETLVEIAPKAAWAAGLMLASTGHQLCLINAAGHMVAQQAFQSGAPLTDFLDELPGIIHELARRWQLRPEAYVGLTVCLPGIVNHQTGYVLNSISLDLHNYPLEAELKKRLTGRVIVERSATCGAYAERYLGGWGLAEHFLYLQIRPEKGGMGGRRRYSFGLAIMIEGQMYYGFNSAAGEFHGSFLPAHLRPELPLDVTDPRRQEEVGVFLDGLGVGIGSLINLFDPQLFIIAGDDDLWSAENLRRSTTAALAALTEIPDRKIRILRSSLGLPGIMHGAALLCLHRGLADLLDAPAPAGS